MVRVVVDARCTFDILWTLRKSEGGDMMIRCKDCKFYLGGYCHRHAPVLVVYDPGDGSTASEAQWPHTFDGNQCGDGEQKEA